MTNHMVPEARMASIRREFGEHGGVNMSVEASSTFTVLDPNTMPALFDGSKTPQEGCYLYGRSFNPTVYHLSQQLAALEGAEAAYCSASGMAAISATLLNICNSGDHIVAANTIYGGSYALTQEFLPAKANIHTTMVDITNLEAVEAAITHKTRVIYAETVSNPTLRVTNISGLANIAKAHNIKLVIDNTFSPLSINPLALGADVVVHSLTKFINGASDIVAGAICADADFITSLMDLHTGSLMILGPVMDPETASKISLRLPHLGLRIKEHARRTQIFAERLLALDLTVSYPGLANHPDHALIKQQSCLDYGFGGLLTLNLGSAERAERLMECLQNKHGFGYMAVSLGYFDSLMSAPRSSTSSEMSDEDLSTCGIENGLIRLSIGYTGTLEQRWQQMEQGLYDVGIINALTPHEKILSVCVK